MCYLKKFLWVGIFAIIFAWFVIGLCWALNPWFAFTEDAFSDFGGMEACCPELYNYGLIITGVLIVLYGSAICLIGEDKLEVVGASYLSLAGVFLALIGIFPSGTKPHTFVSSWFFLQIYIAFIVLSAGMMRRKLIYGLEVLIISSLAVPVAILAEILWGWPSAAVLEAYGIIIIDICVVLITMAYLKLIERR